MKSADRKSIIVWIVALTVTSNALVLPSAAIGETTEQSSASCITVQTDPPAAGVNPKCRPAFGEQDSGPFEQVRARSTGVDVLVEWSLRNDTLAVTEFHILRGATPASLERVGVAPPGLHSYVDEGALALGNPVWYAVELAVANGTVYRSQPVLIQAVGR